MSRLRSQQGFTMIPTVIGMSAIAMIALVAVTSVNGDLHLTQNDLAHKQAYEAAKAGIDDYAFHLHSNGNYWASCTGNAVNPPNNTERRRPVPGKATSAEYAIELLPANGHAECEPLHPTTSMIESSGAMKGTFRVRSTGFAEKSQVSITATFKTASFLDYVYFTQLETPDPLTYAFKKEEELKEANIKCGITIWEGRTNKNIPNTNPARRCEQIVFKSGDKLNGPVHSNDTIAICGSPTFGRNSLDAVEVSAPSPGWVAGENAGKFGSGCPAAAPEFKSPLAFGVPKLVPPPSNSELEKLTDPSYKFIGQINVCLEGNQMKIGTAKNCVGGATYQFPSKGLIYVSNNGCSGAYSPWTAAYTFPSTCGNVYVHGTYSGQLTIAANNDIIVDGSLTHTGTGLLGLIANNFVRIFHPYPTEKINSENGAIECGNGTGEEKIENITVDAAILSINHSFIVDHYNCGGSLGTLTVNGAISQKFRGTVGTSGGTGYTKSYNYDDRLKYLEPPNFIEPEKLPWVIGRETIG